MEMEKISKIWWYLGCIRVIWHKKTVILFCCDKWLFMFIITQRTILFELDMNKPSDSQCNTYTAMTTLSHVIQAQYLFETNSNIFVFLLLACLRACVSCLFTFSLILHLFLSSFPTHVYFTCLFEIIISIFILSSRCRIVSMRSTCTSFFSISLISVVYIMQLRYIIELHFKSSFHSLLCGAWLLLYFCVFSVSISQYNRRINTNKKKNKFVKEDV